MQVETDVTFDDLRAVRKQGLTTAEGRRAIASEFVVGATLGCVPYLAMAIALSIGLGFVVPGNYVLWLAAGQFVLWILFYVWALFRAIEAGAKAASQVAAGRHVLTISDAGVHEVRPHGEVSHRWSAVTDVIDARQHVLIAVGPDGQYVIPKRSFPTPEMAAAFVEAARALRARGTEGAGGAA